MSSIDLHMHSAVSFDGEFSPRSLVLRAEKQKMKLIALSDHDAISNNSLMKEYCQKAGIGFISGCEFSTVMNDGTELHVLGYNIDLDNDRIREREKRIEQILLSASGHFLAAAREQGFHFNDEDVYALNEGGRVCPENIAAAILNDSRNDSDSRLVIYRKGGKSADNPCFNFYKDYYAQGKPCYFEIEGVNAPLKEVDEMIHQAHGFMVLAHPNHNIGHNLEKLQEICDAHLDGIEAFSSYHHEPDKQFYLNEALKRDLIVTTGSDFHGRNKPAIEMGSTVCDEELVLKGLRRYLCL